MLAVTNNELGQTNRMLLAVSVASVVLLGPSFVMGYFWGFRVGLSSTPRDEPTVESRATQLAASPTTATASGLIPHAGPHEKGQVYLQLITVAKSRSTALVDRLRNDGFAVVTSEVPEKPGLHRVLIGPLHEGQVDSMRAELLGKGFPGDSAIVRTF